MAYIKTQEVSGYTDVVKREDLNKESNKMMDYTNSMCTKMLNEVKYERQGIWFQLNWFQKLLLKINGLEKYFK